MARSAPAPRPAAPPRSSLPPVDLERLKAGALVAWNQQANVGIADLAGRVWLFRMERDAPGIRLLVRVSEYGDEDGPLVSDVAVPAALLGAEDSRDAAICDALEAATARLAAAAHVKTKAAPPAPRDKGAGAGGLLTHAPAPTPEPRARTGAQFAAPTSPVRPSPPVKPRPPPSPAVSPVRGDPAPGNPLGIIRDPPQQTPLAPERPMEGDAPKTFAPFKPRS